jgi:hypothetical protein
LPSRAMCLRRPATPVPGDLGEHAVDAPVDGGRVPGARSTCGRFCFSGSGRRSS